MPSKCAPCIVLGLETQIGLSIARELGRSGVPVVGIAQSPDAIGLWSRYVVRRLIAPKPRSPELIELIRNLGEEFGKCCLITVSEANLIWLTAHRREFGHVKAVLPPQSALNVVLDKQRTLSAAKAVGITIPETAEPTSIADVEHIADTFRFPLILKWKDPNTAMHFLRPFGIELRKVEYVYAPSGLLDVARRYLPAGKWPLVQEYCPGVGLGQFFYMHKGNAIRRFQHIRVAEWPPEGGFSSVCDSISLGEHEELQEKSISLLQAVGWEGVAMVEYRLDPATHQAVLMEINGRYWGSYPLAMHSNADFALIAHYIENHLPLPALPQVRVGIRCRMVATEVKRLIRIWFQPELIADRSFKRRPWAELSRFILDFLRPNVRYYVWAVSDPGPFFADVRNIGRALLRRTLGKLLSDAGR